MKSRYVGLMLAVIEVCCCFGALAWGPDRVIETGWIESFDVDCSEEGTIYVAANFFGEPGEIDPASATPPQNRTKTLIFSSVNQGQEWSRLSFEMGSNAVSDVKLIVGRDDDQILLHVFHAFFFGTSVGRYQLATFNHNPSLEDSELSRITSDWEHALGTGTYQVARSSFTDADSDGFADDYVLVAAYHQHADDQIHVWRSLDRGETWQEVARLESIPGFWYSWDIDLAFVSPDSFVLVFPKYLPSRYSWGDTPTPALFWAEGRNSGGEWRGPWMIRHERIDGDDLASFFGQIYPRLGVAHSAWRDSPVSIVLDTRVIAGETRQLLEQWSYVEADRPDDWQIETLARCTEASYYECLDVFSPRRLSDPRIDVLLSWEDELTVCQADASGSPGVSLSYGERGVNDHDYYPSRNGRLCPKLVRAVEPPYVDCLGIVYSARELHPNVDSAGVDLYYDSECHLELQMPSEAIMGRINIFEILVEESYPLTQSPGSGPLSVEFQATATAACEATYSHVLEITWNIGGGDPLLEAKIEIAGPDGSSYVHTTKATVGTGKFGLLISAGGTVTVTVTATTPSGVSVSAKSVSLSPCE